MAGIATLAKAAPTKPIKPALRKTRTSIIVYQAQSCCAVQDIYGIQHYGTDAEEMLLDICRAIGGEQLGSQRYNFNEKLAVGGLLMFTAVVDDTSGRKTTYGYEYGPALAAYLREHKLGEVVDSPEAPNRRNHPNHICKMWIWKPDPDALKAWWKARFPSLENKKYVSGW